MVSEDIFMKKYIKSSSGDKNYIGGRLYDLPDSYWDDEDAHADRFETQNAYINNFDHGGYNILYRPDSTYHRFELFGGPDILADISDGMRIKDGIDVIAYKDHIDLVGYYSGSRDVVKIYPIDVNKAIELQELFETADFDESTIIENEIAQYTYGGATIEDVLNSWKNY